MSDYPVPEAELYSLIQLFYSGQYEEIVNSDLSSDFDFSSDVHLEFAKSLQRRAKAIIDGSSNDQLMSTYESEIALSLNSSDDTLIAEFAKAWKGLTIDDENIDDCSAKGAYYFFDELCGSDNTATLKTWICLLSAHLKMGHLEEANVCLDKIKSMEQSANLKLENWQRAIVINEIALNSIQGTPIDDLVKQIKQFDCEYTRDLSEKESLFDQVVKSF
ncbi:hypothetical protein DAMA08_000590 [Martiniozyma asiatica (nom. inval.)]|nr:hypothetical protein DAMA08_000590 [Martiniozyma asiatica]